MCQSTLFHSIFESVANQGYFIGNDTLSVELCRNLKKHALLMLNQKGLSARIGSEHSSQGLVHASHIRNDRIAWIDETENKNEALSEYLNIVNGIKDTFNRFAYMGLNQFEAHFAQYDKSGFYKPHKDNPQGRSARKITIISYLNDKWEPEDGGHLTIYHKSKTIQVEPKERTLVCFISEDLLHSVEPCNTSRLSLTGWLRAD